MRRTRSARSSPERSRPRAILFIVARRSLINGQLVWSHDRAPLGGLGRLSDYDNIVLKYILCVLIWAILAGGV